MEDDWLSGRKLSDSLCRVFHAKKTAVDILEYSTSLKKGRLDVVVNEK